MNLQLDVGGETVVRGNQTVGGGGSDRMIEKEIIGVGSDRMIENEMTDKMFGPGDHWVGLGIIVLQMIGLGLGSDRMIEKEMMNCEMAEIIGLGIIVVLQLIGLGIIVENIIGLGIMKVFVKAMIRRSVTILTAISLGPSQR